LQQASANLVTGISKLSHAESDEQLNQVGAGSLAAICVSHLWGSTNIIENFTVNKYYFVSHS